MTAKTEPATMKPAATNMDDDARYRVVVARDRSFDGAFIVAVRTTGVYCRPYCPSRTPKRENVSFYETPEQARADGYRACRRCRPDESAAPDPRLDVVRAACRAIESAEDECPSLEALGTAAGISPFHLQRSFKAVMGISPRQYSPVVRTATMKAPSKDLSRATSTR
jgi:AraC family transcriptional regulator of adaptative response/methylated-DNA-[protein]-cysteine methyltransferase